MSLNADADDFVDGDVLDAHCMSCSRNKSLSAVAEMGSVSISCETMVQMAVNQHGCDKRFLDRVAVQLGVPVSRRLGLRFGLEKPKRIQKESSLIKFVAQAGEVVVPQRYGLWGERSGHKAPFLCCCLDSDCPLSNSLHSRSTFIKQPLPTTTASLGMIESLSELPCYHFDTFQPLSPLRNQNVSLSPKILHTA